MKRILLLLLINFLLPRNIKAETIYGEYYKIDEIKDIDKNDVLINTTKYYNTYRTEKIDKGYLPENNVLEKNINDYILINKKTTTKENMETSIEYTDIYFIIKDEEISKIYIDNIAGKTIFNEIKIFSNDKEIKYIPISEENIYTKSLCDNDDETLYKIETNKEILKINLLEKIKLKDLKIELRTNSKKYLNLNFPEHKINLGVNFSNFDVEKHIIKIIESDKRLSDRYFLEQEKNYKYYELNEIPTNIYLNTDKNIIKDDYKIETTYYKREKLILNDNLIIIREDEKVDKLVDFASDIVFINCDINYKVNGKYTCNFKLRDISINKNIIINIPENTKSENNSINEISNTNVPKKIIKKNKLEITKLNNNKKQFNKLNTKKEISSNTIKLKTEKNKLTKNWIWLIIFIIEILLFILKRYKKFCRKSLKK